jgi:hypothetical protein
MTRSAEPVQQKNETSPSVDLVSPAFVSKRQQIWFLALLVCILILPQVITWSGTVSRRNSYEIMPENQGAYSFVMKEVFDNTEDIDILFLGSSILFNGVDTPQVQKELSLKLGRPARVVTFGHYFNSIDILHMQVRDLLERKRVRLVVMSIPRMPYNDGPSTTAHRFFRYSDDKETFDELPFKYQAVLYSSAILRTPQDLLTLVRPNGSTPSDFAQDLGADKSALGMGRDPLTFERYAPASPQINYSDLIYSDDSREKFRFTGDPIPFYQNVHFDKLIDQLRQHHTSVMMLNIPQYSERHSDKIVERDDWAKRFQMDIPLVGVPPATLFAGLNEEEIEKLHFDEEHLNLNGNEFFTRTVLPAILMVYETHASKTF